MKTFAIGMALLFAAVTSAPALAETTVIKKHGVSHSKKVIIKHHGGMASKKVVIKHHD